ncbi:MAG: hypothetical protein ABJA67_05110 [Chthonomonadales bacterium]
MNRPPNIHLPFFAYGLFKPGQLCHFRIRDFVQSSSISIVPGYLKERDGIPLLIPKDNAGHIKGYLIYFVAGREDEAYERIIEIEPDKVYRWDVVKVNGSAANFLVGKRADTGSSELDHVDEWDGKSDPFFNQGIAEVEAILEANSSFDWDYRALFRLQMAYILLWSAVERYAGLKYHLGKEATEKVYRIAGEKCFQDALKKVVHNKREVYRTTDLDKCTLDPDNPKKSIEYYYQVRSNSVHRGKAVSRDFETVKSSLTELLFIFKELLRDAFEGSR